jgi:hypothetical protein
MADEQDPIAKAAKELKNRQAPEYCQACGPLGHVWTPKNRYWTPDVGTPCDCGRSIWGGRKPPVPRATIPARDGTRYEVINKQGTLRRVGPKKGKR